MLNQHQTIRDNIAKYNKPNPLIDYLVPFVGNKNYVKILDVGSGAYSVIGSYLGGVDLEIHHVDNQDFSSFYQKYNFTPIVDIERADMENLSYPDNEFDIVCSINALDHTNDAYRAVQEMIRVCKPGGHVYLDCHLDQADTGHKHKWNAKMDGKFVGADDFFDLKSLGFKIDYIDNGGETRYNKIVAILEKQGGV